MRFWGGREEIEMRVILILTIIILMQRYIRIYKERYLIDKWEIGIIVIYNLLILLELFFILVYKY